MARLLVAPLIASLLHSAPLCFSSIVTLVVLPAHLFSSSIQAQWTRFFKLGLLLAPVLFAVPTCSRGVLARALPAWPPFAAPENTLPLTLPSFPNVLALTFPLLPNVLALALPLLSGAAGKVVNWEGRGCGCCGCTCCGGAGMGYAWKGGIDADSMDGAGVEDMTCDRWCC